MEYGHAMDPLGNGYAHGVQPRARFGQRVGAYLIDIVLVNFVVFVLSFLVQAAAGLLLSLAVGLGYFAVFEGSGSGQTVGKRLLGIRVVDFESGTPITYGRAFVRAAGRYLSGLVFLLGYLWMLWDRDAQTWHDKFAATTVVPVKSFPVERWPG
jgi:uncharacterized RDD family membrane protein YckC